MQFNIIDGPQAINDPVNEETISAFEQCDVAYLPWLAFQFEDTKRRPCRALGPMASGRTGTCAVPTGNCAERAANAQSCKTCALIDRLAPESRSLFVAFWSRVTAGKPAPCGAAYCTCRALIAP